MTLQGLHRAIGSRDCVVGVIGLGYVGLPVACAVAAEGFQVIAVDRDASRVQRIAAGENPIIGKEPGLSALLSGVARGNQFTVTTDYNSLVRADVTLLCVDTPVDQNHRPRLEALESACASLGKVMKVGVLVVVESTVPPGTMESIVKPRLEEASGRQIDEGFFLGHCPERVMPGKLLQNLRTMRRVCGGSTPETAAVMSQFYSTFVRAELDETDCLTAELVKTTENAFRDVNIAFANEVALICDKVGGDVWKVRELVNKAPERSMHTPGPGVGGHCIPKDPWLLVANAEGLDSGLIASARAVNDAMPLHMVDLIDRALRRSSRTLKGSAVSVLGYAYLANSDDTRNSPSETLCRHLRERGASVSVHDPFVPKYSSAPVEDVVRGTDCVVIMVTHDAYRLIDWRKVRGLMRTPAVVDGRAVADRDALLAMGFMYLRLGARHS